MILPLLLERLIAPLLGFRFASPQAILKRSFAAEGAGTDALEKRTRDRSNLGEVILNSVFCFLTSALALRIEFEFEDD